MALRVTLDTNVLDLACRPARFPKDPRQPRPDEGGEYVGGKSVKGCITDRAFHMTDPTESYYLNPGEGAKLRTWIDKVHEVTEAIEARGIGFAQVRALGEGMAESDPRDPRTS
jgi:hypothetical protein